MNPTVVTACALALIMASAGCNRAAAPEPPATHEAQAAKTGQEYDMAGTSGAAAAAPVREQFALATGDVKASDLIGATVQDAAGNDLATVTDIWLGTPDETPMLVVRATDPGAGDGKLHTIAFDEATFLPVTVDDPAAHILLTEETIDALPLLAEDTLADFQLASEMIGADANLAYANRREQIDDLILGPDGRPRFAVVTDAANPDQIGQVVIGADALQVAQGDGDGTLLIELDPADFASAKTMQVADNGK
ncbi:MAG: PRC-barrel domain-containing protein [Hyphomonas sp.]|nr:PRC-barrel domain-containing protein [Hyphomonas sp.]MCB9972221.1 PRC-barrel domain-containing protein [Hyphomonas sp.]